MGRKKLTRTKNRNTYSLENLKLLREIRDKITPMGLHATDSQALDVVIVVLHKIMFDDNLQVTDIDALLKMVNGHVTREFSEFLEKTLTEFGHTDVATHWQEDGTVTVVCDKGGAIIPPVMFGRADLRTLKATGLPV